MQTCSWRELAWATLVAGLLAALCFYPGLTGDKLIYSADYTGSDLLELSIPRRYLAAQALQHKSLPFWEPLVGNGFPLLAEGQSGVFYPLTLPLFICLSPVLASNLTIVFTIALAMLGAYLLARNHQVSPLAAAICALAFGLSTQLTLRLKHTNLIEVIAWLPLCLLATRMLLLGALHNTSCRLASAALAGVLTMQILAGHPHALAVCAVSSIIYGCALLVGEYFSQPKTSQDGQPSSFTLRSLTKLVLFWMLSCLVALALGAIQLYPTYELTSLSSRSSAVSLTTLDAYPLLTNHLVRLVNPFITGNPANGDENLLASHQGVFWECTAYLGIIPLLLALSVPWSVPKRQWLPIALAAAICLVLALGPKYGLYWLLWKVVPGFDHFRFPARFLIGLTSLLALLAGLSANGWLNRLGNQRTRILAGLVLVLLTGLDLGLVNASYQAYLPSQSLEAPPNARLLQGSCQRLATPDSGPAWQAAMTGKGWLNQPAQLTAQLNNLPADVQALWGLAHHGDRALWEGGLELQTHYAWHQALNQGYKMGQTPTGERLLLVNDASATLLRRQGVSHLVSSAQLVAPTQTAQLGLPQWARRLNSEPMSVYALANPLPLVRLVTQSLSQPKDMQLTWRLLQTPLINPEQTAMMEDTASSGRPGHGQVRIVSNDNCRRMYHTSCPNTAYLVILENWYPCWQATIDGQPAPIKRADCAFMGIEVPAGQHQVELRFVPTSFYFGLGISLTGLVALMLLIFPALRFKLPQPS